MESDKCPRCGAELTAQSGGGGSSVCPRCGSTTHPYRPLAVPVPPIAKAARRAKPATPRHKPKPRYATCRAVTGAVVGLERVSEQHIEGSGFISGSQSVSGYYHGAQGFMTPTGRMSPASGQLSGSGSLLGSAFLRTRYAYETRFFIHGDDGVDRPFRFPGVEYLPLREGHTVSTVWCKNDRGKSLLVALVNHNTGPAILPVATEDEIIDHLGIPLSRRVRLDPDEYEQLLDEQQVAREHRRRLHTRKRRTREQLAPWLIIACVVSLSVICFGLILGLGANNETGGVLLLALGGIGLLACSGALAYLHLDESGHSGRPRTRRFETHVTVPNDEEVDEELDRIETFIASVVRSAASGRG